MNAVFADSFYFFALLNPNDEAHGRAAAFSASFDLAATGAAAAFGGRPGPRFTAAGAAAAAFGAALGAALGAATVSWIYRSPLAATGRATSIGIPIMRPGAATFKPCRVSSPSTLSHVDRPSIDRESRLLDRLT